jgi:hypothetical protein
MITQITRVWLTNLVQRIPHEVTFRQGVARLQKKTGWLEGEAWYWLDQACDYPGLDETVIKMRRKGLMKDGCNKRRNTGLSAYNSWEDLV